MAGNACSGEGERYARLKKQPTLPPSLDWKQIEQRPVLLSQTYQGFREKYGKCKQKSCSNIPKLKFTLLHTFGQRQSTSGKHVTRCYE